MNNDVTPVAISAGNLVPALIADAARRGFTLGYDAQGGDPALWRERVIDRARGLILPDLPDRPGTAEIIAQEDRSDHLIRHLRLTFVDGLPTEALFALPHGLGPFPAVLALHDHGSEFRVGAAKCLAPPGRPPEAATDWWERFFAGRPSAEDLLGRGFAVLSVDALNWGARAGQGYEAQQALAANLMQIGLSPAGFMAWEDLRAVEFLAAQPEVDAARIGVTGFSMGAFRAWQLAALSPDIKAFVASCWMASLPGLLVEGNNQIRGQSAFWMTHPGLARAFDLPDIAALAAPKPGFFQWGEADPLFPPAAVQSAQAKLAAVWRAYGAADSLIFDTCPGGHLFTPERRDKAHGWLASIL